MVKRLIPPLLALGFALVAATDWGLESPGQPVICAVDQQSCEWARNMMYDGKLFHDLPHGGWVCRPRPGCRPEVELCIAGYNCP